jgi:hypothetical protein
LEALLAQARAARQESPALWESALLEAQVAPEPAAE